MAGTGMVALEVLLEETVTELELETTGRPGAQGERDPSEGGETVVLGRVQEQETASVSVKEKEETKAAMNATEENIKYRTQQPKLNDKIANIYDLDLLTQTKQTQDQNTRGVS